MRPGSKNLLDDVRETWSKLQQQFGLADVDVQFLPIARKDDLGMDALLEGTVGSVKTFTCFTSFSHDDISLFEDDV